MRAHEEHKKQNFDKWVLLPASAGAICSAVAGFSTKGLSDAAAGYHLWNLSDVSALVAAVVGIASALGFSWYADRNRERDH